MFDGKALNSIVGNAATQRCPNCLKTMKQFSNVDDSFKIIQDSIQYGLGLLHAEVKCFENLLHLSYKLDVKTWTVRKCIKGNSIKSNINKLNLSSINEMS